jgi:acyl dehydratase
MAGRYFEDFSVGETYKHWPGRTITATDNTWFTLLTMNQHPIHFDEEYAKHTEFGKPLVNSALTRRCSTATRSTPSRPCSRNESRSRARRKESSP